MPNTPLQRWRYALKPNSWPKLFVPAIFGQALGAAHLGRLDLPPAIVGMGLTFLLVSAIVLLNDYGDREVDGIKRRMFPGGCSPKTIPDRILPAHQVLFAGVAASLAFVGASFWAAGWAGRAGLGWVGLLALLVFLAYSMPPLRLNYRGGGEFLEMVGVGFVLPWMNAYLQGGLGAESVFWLPKGSALFPALMLLAFSSAIASGLSDEVSDRSGGKRTITTLSGNLVARRLVELCVALGAAALLVAGALSEHVPFVVVLLPSALILWRWKALRGLSQNAITNAFVAQAHYKNKLHAAVWGGIEGLGFLLLMHRLFLR